MFQLRKFFLAAGPPRLLPPLQKPLRGMLARQIVIEEGAGLVGELGERIREGFSRVSFD